MLNEKNRYIGKLFIIAAPSGGGKTSVALGVVDILKNSIPIEKVTTFTTRKIRQNEVPGLDYHFLSVEKFLELKKQGLFLETTKYGGNYYGSPASIVPELKKGKSFIMITDIAGAKNFKSNILPEAVTIWLSVESFAVLTERLKKRNTEIGAALNKRLQLAGKEIAQEDAEHFFQYHVLNDDLNKTIQAVSEIIKNELDSINLKKATDW